MIRFLAAFLLLLGAAQGALAQPGGPSRQYVEASLVSERSNIEPGSSFTLAVRLVMEPGWHVYWRNPGDSGLAPEIVWELPDGFQTGPTAWPAPERIAVQHLMNFGFEGEAVLLVPVTAPTSLKAGRSVGLGAKLSYLVCSEICIPGSAELGLDLPVAEPGADAPGTANPDLFERARAALPLPSEWPSRVTSEGGRLVLHVQRAGLASDALSKVAFFPYAESVLENAADQVASVDATGLHLALTPADPKGAPPTQLAGVLRFDERTAEGTIRRAFAIGDALEPAAEHGPSQRAADSAREFSVEPSLSFWSALGLAFIGGLILNLMPCVFPVLSIKVLSLVKQAGTPIGRVRLHGFAYTSGVLASFLALGGLLIALKSGGAGIGWGFQLQSPAFVAALAYLVLAVGLSLSGVFHIGGAAVGLGDGLTRRAGLQGSFFTGVLATIVATPCTAPFMGAAVGFALTQSSGLALAVFASLGLGLALPFLMLTIWPAAIARLPRPGAWMDTLKGALAFPIYATVAWLVWVLSQQVGPNGLFAILLGLVLVAFAAWVWARAAASAAYGRGLGRGLALVAILAAGSLVAVAQTDPAADPSRASLDGTEAFTQARLDALRREGRNVFVDMTAAWCITCQVNERGVLASSEVRGALAQRSVVTLRGDWTNQNPEITRLLEAHGRSGVPLYLVYAGNGEPEILPQILTKGAVLSAVDKLPVQASAKTSASMPASKAPEL